MQMPDLNDLRQAGGGMLDAAGEFISDPLGVANDALESLSDSVSGAYTDYLSPLIPDSLENAVGLGREAMSISQASEPERATLFGEIFESILRRVFPDGSEVYDVLNNLFTNPRESWDYENEFEVATAIFGLMPNSFKSLVLSYTIVPMLNAVGLTELAEFALTDPDEFINRLRTLESDIGAVYTGLRNFGLVR